MVQIIVLHHSLLHGIVQGIKRETTLRCCQKVVLPPPPPPPPMPITIILEYSGSCYKQFLNGFGTLEKVTLDAGSIMIFPLAP